LRAEDAEEFREKTSRRGAKSQETQRNDDWLSGYDPFRVQSVLIRGQKKKRITRIEDADYTDGTESA